ncbi:hypothetical protein K461DRAFT_78288 [Myriangium duriaei CBS 260.36]|uniref:Zn(2)-C6 fungal-type domain-containing protein n=1 Tax=Myriangium duriaei CBS 260.36 TaxID=1168546 RepID=A0A9P4J8Z4_9PEZI|nr:hypothetical protein K461DRAFT_78288 [Myriangium duriaei CBS 260.36]
MATIEDNRDSAQNRLLYKQKRARSQLSCRHCRQGKLKCDREHPCNQCMKRSRESTCVYLPPAEKKQSGQNVRNRIQHLEKLVVDLMNSKPNRDTSVPTDNVGNVGNNDPQSTAFSQMTPPQDIESSESNQESPEESTQSFDESAFGRMRIGKDRTAYVEKTHWSALLNEISDLKRDLSEDDDSELDDLPADNSDDLESKEPLGIGSILRSPIRRSKAELIRAMPPREVVDRYVYKWFNAPDPFKSIIHISSFIEDYARFWQNPTRTPTMWIGLLYSIISLAAKIPFHKHPNAGSSEAQTILTESLRYHELAASAAVLADYTTPKKYTLECLILYINGMRSVNSFIDTWQLLGIVVRLGLRMGYHRDGSHFPSLPIFDQEMRRRIWYSLYMIEVLVSFQIGLPSMLRSVHSDTKAPGNYLDSDLYPRMDKLPPPRPEQEITPVSYGLSKVKLCNIFAAAAEISHTTEPASYDHVLDLDNQLDAAHDTIPGPIRIRPFNEYLAERPETVMWSFNLELLYLKTKIVLHRPFMKSHESSPAALASRRICVDAAMKALGHHHEIYRASQAGGQLEVARMYMGSISTYDFLLASMIICLELAQMCASSTPLIGRSVPYDAYPKYKEMMNLLSTTHKIWSKDSKDANAPTFVQGTFRSISTVKETEKAAKVVAIMLARGRALEPTLPAGTATTAEPNDMQMFSQSTPSTDYTLSNHSTFDIATGNTGHSSWTPDAFNPDQMDLNLIGDILDVPDQVDWVSYHFHIVSRMLTVMHRLRGIKQ